MSGRHSSASQPGPQAPSLVALLHGPDRQGLVARTSGWIFERGGNILHADQHRDDSQGVFFQRIEWTPAAGTDRDEDAGAFAAFVGELGMSVRVERSDRPHRVALFVSKIPHCFEDLLLRYRLGELPCRLVCVISNHLEMQSETERAGLPFFHIPVSPATKQDAESRALEVLAEQQVNLVVLARYMQILSGEFLRAFGAPVINIHHSFLPAFAGARPYHQAYERGVKLIGATAHYATEVLDDGPIIQQDVTHVNHRHEVADLIRKGRDLERSVLAQAVRWHLDSRVLVYGRKTVVFD